MAHQRGKIVISDKELDELAQVIGGLNFVDLIPENRVKVYDLALKKAMMEDLHEIRRWFEESKTFDGIA